MNELSMIIFILLFLIIISIDFFFFRKKKSIFSFVTNFVRSLLYIFLVVFLIKSFFIEPFRIPSRSMVPSLFDGDFILVNKFIYGSRIPVINIKFINNSFPKIGDILVFKHFSKKNYVKRVIGVSGDHIKYNNENLYINDNFIPKLYFFDDIDINNDNVINFPVESYKEKLTKKIHYNVYVRPWVKNIDYMINDIIVPNNSYFVVGDNRNTSYDSRFWGVVNDNEVLGKVFFVWFSWDMYYKDIRWNRVCIEIL